MSWNRLDLPVGLPHPVEVASSATLLGAPALGEGAVIAEGTVIRDHGGGVAVGAATAVLENSVVIGRADRPVTVGRRTVFGHRCLIVGAEVGDLCEIGNASILLPGARLGDRCFLGEGTLIPPGTVVPDGAVVVGRPGRAIRTAGEADLARLARLRGGDLSLPPSEPHPVAGTSRAGASMGHLYEYRGTWPTVDPSAVLFDSAELTGDVVVGPESIIGAGVKIIGDAHGPVRIGARVQILENTVLHLLPDNRLVLEDDVVIGPGAMIHGCHIGAGTVVEPGAIVCDWSSVGRGCVVRAGSLVKQRDAFGDRLVLEGFPARAVDRPDEAPPVPVWALRLADVATLVRRD